MFYTNQGDGPSSAQQCSLQLLKQRSSREKESRDAVWASETHLRLDRSARFSGSDIRRLALDVEGGIQRPLTEEARAIEPLALIMPPRRLQTPWGRVSDPSYRFERFRF
jgi:hypothetical protein